MNPVSDGTVFVFAMLHDTLAEREIRDKPFHPTSALGEGWDSEVGCLAIHVLVVGGSSDFGMGVELGTTDA